MLCAMMFDQALSGTGNSSHKSTVAGIAFPAKNSTWENFHRLEPPSVLRRHSQLGDDHGSGERYEAEAK